MVLLHSQFLLELLLLLVQGLKSLLQKSACATAVRPAGPHLSSTVVVVAPRAVGVVVADRPAVDQSDLVPDLLDVFQRSVDEVG